jgi:tRNA pseudouridine55 synthase
MAVINVYKPPGATPLRMIQLLRELYSIYDDVRMTYAGRLDPMAEGVLIILSDDDALKKDEFLGLDKMYEAEILFGFETDTYDALGIAKSTPIGQDDEWKAQIWKEFRKFQGANILSLPPYSSYKINGKPLFYWAREGKLDELIIPQRTMTVHEIRMDDAYTISSSRLLKRITKNINLIEGDFRQEEILASWKSILETNTENFIVAKVQIHCSAGTYIRSIAQEIGKRLGTGGVLLQLTRTRVGSYSVNDSLRI